MHGKSLWSDGPGDRILPKTKVDSRDLIWKVLSMQPDVHKIGLTWSVSPKCVVVWSKMMSSSYGLTWQASAMNCTVSICLFLCTTINHTVDTMGQPSRAIYSKSVGIWLGFVGSVRSNRAVPTPQPQGLKTSRVRKGTGAWSRWPLDQKDRHGMNIPYEHPYIYIYMCVCVCIYIYVYITIRYYIYIYTCT